MSPNDKTIDEREAEVAALMARAQDQTDEYDGHHGSDRSPDSLRWMERNDPISYARVMAKIKAGQ